MQLTVARACGVAVMLLAFSASAADGSAARARSVADALGEYLQIRTFFDANATFCSAFSREYGESVQAAADTWLDSARIRNAEHIVTDIGLSQSEATFVSAERQAFKEHLGKLERQARSQPDAWCQRFLELLAADKLSFEPALTSSLHTLNAFHAVHVARLRQSHIALEKRALDPLALHDNGQTRPLNRLMQPLPDEFYCYGELSGSGFSAPDFTVQIGEGNRYKSSYGSGGYANHYDDKDQITKKLIWSGVLGDSRRSQIQNTIYGQEIRFTRLELDGVTSDYACYQRGPSHTRALVEFQLKEPPAGVEYQCRDVAGTELDAFKILPGYRYRLNGESGRFTLDLRARRAAAVEFTSGPLGGSSASYQESMGTGLQTFDFKRVDTYGLATATSSRLTMSCTSLQAPVYFQEYGDDATPAPPADAGGLDGLYAARRPFKSTETTNYDFYFFTPEGYVYRRVPSRGLDSIRCDLTFPNGEPSCDIYRLNDDQIEILSGGSITKVVDINDLTAVPAETPTRLEGKYKASIANTTGMCLPGFSCSSWHRISVLNLTADGRFQFSGSSSSSNYSAVGGGAAHGGGSSSSSESGTYHIDGNAITYHYDNGVVKEDFIAAVGSTGLQTNGWTYLLSEDE